MVHGLEMRHGLMCGCIMRPMEAAIRGPIVKVFSVVLSPEVEVFLVEVSLSTFNIEGPFRQYYRLHKATRVQVRLREARISGIQVLVASSLASEHGFSASGTFGSDPKAFRLIWAFERLSLYGLSVDFGVNLVKTTSDGHFIDSIESEMLSQLGKHFAFTELRMNSGVSLKFELWLVIDSPL
ncbi:hypothetical protein HAX54_052196 [Datura stramonium]|uniref:Uncharacterized protein n=1 Tax=Datura stramonium TaxID=4076 RepID=A0ABS8SYK6_DATST|nr:hypothetical protein [Datura stramonium]